MKRREFITLLGGAAATWPRMAGAQQPTMPVIGFLHPGSLATNRRNLAAFHQGLSEAGYADGQNLKLEFRWANNELARLPLLAADLVDLQAAVIVAAGAVASPVAAKGATVKLGLVASLNRPGGNVTGLTLVNAGLPGKRLDFVSQLLPQAMRIAYLAGPSNAWTFEEETSEARQAAQALGREIIVVGGRSDFDFEIAFDTLVHARSQGPDRSALWRVRAVSSRDRPRGGCCIAGLGLVQRCRAAVGA
jgi:putative ABC transport system substrate-binding protein